MAGAFRQFVDRYGVWLLAGAAVILLVGPSARSWLAGPAPQNGIAWRTDLTAALAEAKATHKLVLADFSASWCPPCQRMKREAWPDPQVRALAQGKYIPVFLDVDTTGGKDAGGRYRVMAIPTIIVLSPDGEALRRTNFLTTEGLRAFLGG